MCDAGAQREEEEEGERWPNGAGSWAEAEGGRAGQRQREEGPVYAMSRDERGQRSLCLSSRGRERCCRCVGER